jgi:hypothetical protein
LISKNDSISWISSILLKEFKNMACIEFFILFIPWLDQSFWENRCTSFYHVVTVFTSNGDTIQFSNNSVLSGTNRDEVNLESISTLDSSISNINVSSTIPINWSSKDHSKPSCFFINKISRNRVSKSISKIESNVKLLSISNNLSIDR